jgi:hypothetical protein
MGGFKVATGSTGFLKADGTVDTSKYNYLTDETTSENLWFTANILNSSNSQVGQLKFYARILGNVIFGMSVTGYILNTAFPGTSAATKVTLSIPSMYMPKGPIVIYAAYANGYDNMYGNSAWLDSTSLWVHGGTGAGVSTGMTGVNDDAKSYFVAEYFIEPQFLTL